MEWITSENPYEESWRRLMEYANIELTIEAIESIHGKATPKSIVNYKKQAEQARVALLQAREYFDAATNSSLFTQPNHLYYGAVSLSTACMLIRGDGTKSLDYLRKDNKNAHHGLDFSFSIDSKSAKKDLKLLQNSYVRVCKNGHFANWYSTLITTQPALALKTTNKGRSSSSNMEYVGSFDIPSFSDLEGIKKPLDFIIKRLPDLAGDLGRYGVPVEYARGEHRIKVNLNSEQTEHIFIFHGAPSSEVLFEIINRFECDDGVNFSIEVESDTQSGIIRTRKDKKWSFSYPDSRETLDHRVIFFKESVNTPEVVDLYAVSYALSMLSRYFPDIWVSFLESHCKGAKLVERLVQVLILKLPNLMLNQISGKKYTISTHRPLWH